MDGFLQSLLTDKCNNLPPLRCLNRSPAACNGDSPHSPQVELLIRKERCASAEAQLIEVTAELGVPWHSNCFLCFGASWAWFQMVGEGPLFSFTVAVKLRLRPCTGAEIEFSEDAKAARTRTLDQYKGVDSELDTGQHFCWVSV